MVCSNKWKAQSEACIAGWEMWVGSPSVTTPWGQGRDWELAGIAPICGSVGISAAVMPGTMTTHLCRAAVMAGPSPASPIVPQG